MAKVLAVSDFEEDYVYRAADSGVFKDVDFIISCGDVSSEYLGYIISMVNRDLYYVRGNHQQITRRHENDNTSQHWGGIDLHLHTRQAPGDVILAGIDDHGCVSGETALAEVEAGLETAAAGLEPRPLVSSTAWEDGGRCVVEVRVRPPAQGGPVREMFGPAGTVLVRLNDHVQPVACLPESVQWSASERLSSLPANTRERFRRFSRVGSGARRFRAQEYGHAANVSLHTARRDLVWLVRACLVFEVQRGLFETVRFEEDGICGR